MSCPRQLLLVAMPLRSRSAGIASSGSPLALDHRGRATASYGTDSGGALGGDLPDRIYTIGVSDEVARRQPLDEHNLRRRSEQ